jgi:DNA-binding CsgD family transcriptional regulator
MPVDDTVSERDVRAMVRLIGEVAADPGGHAEKKRRLMYGLCQLVGADFWVWALSTSLIPGRQPVYLAAFNGGFESGQFAHFMRAVDHPDMARLTAPLAAELREKRVHLTRLLQQIVPNGDFSPYSVGEFWRAAGIGPILLSYRPLSAAAHSCIALYRRLGRPAFDEHEARIAHIVTSEVPWLHEEGWPQDRGASIPRLAPRQRTVLNLLVRGLSRKEIARGLAISEHTANGYVKAVFRHFKVHSQPELMNRFVQGDGGDRTPCSPDSAR